MVCCYCGMSVNHLVEYLRIESIWCFHSLRTCQDPAVCICSYLIWLWESAQLLTEADCAQGYNEGDNKELITGACLRMICACGCASGQACGRLFIKEHVYHGTAQSREAQRWEHSRRLAAISWQPQQIQSCSWAITALFHAVGPLFAQNGSNEATSTCLTCSQT